MSRSAVTDADRNDIVPPTDIERGERRGAAVRLAEADLRLEGMQLDAMTKSMLERWARGELSADDYRAFVLAQYERAASHASGDEAPRGPRAD